jgi:branched-chain amino acid transport system substrate-binding protein
MKIGKLAAAIVLGAGLFGGLFAAAQAETLKIGVIAPLTGGGAPWGKASEAGVRIAANEVNARGGLDVGGKKYQVEVIAYDDQYKAVEAVSAYNRLLTKDGVKYMFIVLTPETIALQKQVTEDKVLAFSAAGVDRAVPADSKNLFRVLFIHRDYVPAVLGWVKEHLPGRKVAVLSPNDELGWGFRDFVTPYYQKNGYEIVDNELYERSQKDFAPLFTKIIATHPDFIDIGSAAPATAGLLVRQARELGFKGTFLKESGAAWREILATAGPEAAEGTISLHFTNPHSDGYKRLAVEYEKMVGGQPDDLICYQYDAANALMKAISLGGDVDDTAKTSAAFLTKTFPITSALGDVVNLGDGKGHGDPNQMMTTGYISVIKKGDIEIIGKVN